MPKHPFLHSLLPIRFYNALEKSTRQWCAECSCGNCRDLWESGAIRFMAAGEPRRMMRCPQCKSVTVHRIRRKAQAELEREITS